MNANLFRDVECGMDVSRMVELGKFDKEFTAYGCAYRRENETYFAISEHADTIYRLREKLQLQGTCPSNVMSHHVATSVPAGTIDDIWQDVKWELGYKLMETFSEEFLDMLNELNQKPSKNTAWPYLKKWQEALDGRFLKDWLFLFDRLVIACYLAKQLDTTHYLLLKEWLDKTWRQMEDDAVIKDIHSRTLNGFAYLEHGKITYKINAQYMHVCESRQKLLNQGYIVTPIYSETYWFQTQTQFPGKRKTYEEKLGKMMPPCLNIMKSLRNEPAFIDRSLFTRYYESVKGYNDISAETLKNYGYQWNCL